MAEFIEVMKKFDEMCNCYSNCKGCPIESIKEKHKCICDNIMRKYPEEAEEVIMSWEKPIDWSKVEVDTKILVRDFEISEWYKRYFAKFENGKVYSWKNGTTSFTAANDNDIIAWDFAKLVKEGEQNDR